jgi:hypothetical protein
LYGTSSPSFYIAWLSSMFGFIYLTATIDLSLAIASKWNGLIYFTMIFASFALMTFLFFPMQWAWRWLMRELRYGMQKLGVLALRRLERLDGTRVLSRFVWIDGVAA